MYIDGIPFSDTKYRQTKSVSWLDTPGGTIWVSIGFRSYIQPEDPKLRSTPLGVDLDLLFDEDEELFQPIK
jgi:hypothetical protein